MERDVEETQGRQFPLESGDFSDDEPILSRKVTVGDFASSKNCSERACQLVHQVRAVDVPAFWRIWGDRGS